MANNYSLAICELFNPTIHGVTTTSSPNIESHILASHLFSAIEFYADDWESVLCLMRNEYRNHDSFTKIHPIIRNYDNITLAPTYFRLEIVQSQLLSGGETVASIKTHYLKRVQRKWRSILEKRVK